MCSACMQYHMSCRVMWLRAMILLFHGVELKATLKHETKLTSRYHRPACRPSSVSSTWWVFLYCVQLRSFPAAWVDLTVTPSLASFPFLPRTPLARATSMIFPPSLKLWRGRFSTPTTVISSVCALTCRHLQPQHRARTPVRPWLTSTSITPKAAIDLEASTRFLW